MIVEPQSICVIIAAWNSAATIARAVVSALAQAEVAQVVLVDDASTDDTVGAAADSDDGSGRLHIIRLSRNGGPAAARNLALAQSRSVFVAMLDADDFFLPGRFAPMLAAPGWDAIADNPGFVDESRAADFDIASVRDNEGSPRQLSLTEFVRGNISISGRPRGELGFIKPLIRRAFLDDHGLRYDETLRLGEDYALYARILARGGIFLTLPRCGYIGVERANSLSGRHRADDLSALAASDTALLADNGLSSEARSIVRRHRAQIAAKARHRQFLDTRRVHGLGTALHRVIARPQHITQLALAIARDKWRGGSRLPASTQQVRYLLN